MSLNDRWSTHLELLRQQGRYRTLTPPAGIDFTSNDYLGYGSGARGPCAKPQAATTCGVAQGPLSRSGTASRLLRGHHVLWDEVEATLAGWHGAEAVLVMNSGYMANEGLLSTVIEPDDWVASDQFNHASIIDGLRLSRAERFIYRHNDLEHLETGLKNTARGRQPGRQLFIVAEALFSMEGDAAPLRHLAELADRHGAHLIVDEAHTTGCYSKSGSGLVDELGLRARVLATVHTGGKALGVPGAYVCGSRQLRELMVNHCRHLIFTTALPSVVAAWWLDVLRFAPGDEAGRQALHGNAKRFRAMLAEQGIAAPGSAYIVPLLVGGDAEASRAASLLQGQGFDIRAIRPPTVPPGTSRLRLSIHADHTPDTLKAVAAAVARVFHQLKNHP